MLGPIGNNKAKGVVSTPIQASPAIIQDLTTTSPATDYEMRYRKAVINRLDYMQLFGIDVPRDSKEYSLSVAFVSVSLSDELPEQLDVDSFFGTARTRSKLREVGRGVRNTSIPVDEFFNKLRGDNPRLLLRGVAGCGKTTLLRWAAVQAGHGCGDDNSDWRRLVPFIIRLRDYPSGKLPRPQEYPLLLAKELPDPPAGWMTGLLDKGLALVMFDGIDEVPAFRRQEVFAEIRQFIETYSQNFFVVTTRPEAVERPEFESIDFLSARIEPLSPAGRNELIDRWHAAMEQRLRQRNEPEDLHSLCERLKRRLEDNPAVSRLTINPLLCAVVCALHRDREENLPETPVGLCEKLCEMFLDRRDRERPGIVHELAEDAIYRSVDYQHRKGLLARLAHHMVLNGLSAVSEQDAVEQITEGLKSYKLTNLQPEKVFRLLLERSGLLQESSEQTIEFLHNTLKEFLAAELFANAGDFQSLANHCGELSWRPVILFAVALPRDGSEFATRLMRAIRDKTPLNSNSRRKPAGKAERASVRSRQFFFFRCCVTAHQIDDAQIQSQFQTLFKELLPPHTMTDAEALASVCPKMPLVAHFPPPAAGCTARRRSENL